MWIDHPIDMKLPRLFKIMIMKHKNLNNFGNAKAEENLELLKSETILYLSWKP